MIEFGAIVICENLFFIICIPSYNCGDEPIGFIDVQL